MGRKKKASNGENTGNPEFKIASEVLSKAEVKPDVKPEVKPEAKPEVTTEQPQTVNGNTTYGIVIEAKPIEPGGLEAVEAEEGRDVKRELIIQVLRNVVEDMYSWLNTKGETLLKRYVTADPIDIYIDRLTEATDDLYRRLMRFRIVTDRINRIIGGGSARGFTPRDLERMIFEKLASSIAGTMEAGMEQARRRRIADEIIRELMEGKEQGGSQGGNQ